MSSESAYRYERGALAGYRLYCGSVSLYLQFLMSGQALTEVQLAACFKATNEYFDDTDAVGGSPPAAEQPATIADFPDRHGAPIYKFVPKQDWDEYWSKGSVRLAPVQFYRQIEKAQSQDQREGRACLTLDHNGRHMNLGISAGLNIAVFCGTSRAVSGLEKMRERFGSVHLKIKDAGAFTALLAKHMGATRTWTRDVVYNNSMALREPFDHSEISDYLKMHCSHSLTDQGLDEIMRKLFVPMYEKGIFPSVFMKVKEPYSFERERRIAFEMPADLTAPIVIVEPALLDLIEVMD